MPHTAIQGSGLATALQCLALIVRLHNKPVNPQQLHHQFGGGGSLSGVDIIRAARTLGFRAKVAHADWERLRDVPLPAIARQKDGRYVVIARWVDDGRLLIQDPLESRPEVLSRETLESAWSGELILFKPRIWCEDNRRFGLAWFIPALVKYRSIFGQVLIASFAVQCLALLTPLFFQVVIDKVLVHQGLTTLDVLAVGLLLVSAGEVVMSAVRTYLFSHTTNRVDVELGAKLFRHLLALPLPYFRARRVGDSVARVRELEGVRNFLTGSALTVAIDTAFTGVFLAVMYLFSPTLTWIVIGTIPVYVLLSLLVTPTLRARLNEKFSRGAENQAFLVEAVTGVETIKSQAVEPQMQRRWEEQLAVYVKAAFRATHLSNIGSQTASFINKLTVILILWVGTRLVITGDLTVGQLVAFNMLAARVSGPVLRLVQLWQDFQQASISLKRLGDILNTPTEPSYTPNRAVLPRLKGSIVFEHVTFRYRPDCSEILKDISLSIAPGEIIGVVGRSGSGKSTLAKLIQRLLVPEGGRVLIDGVDISLVDTVWLRRQIAVVLQESLLFNRSVRENIALGDPGLAADRVIRAANLAGAHEFISELPEGYDTIVGEQGATLSGGQRQRIAIARALAADPGVLIFDEATSALDYESEHVLQRNMAIMAKGRTVIIIAHRLSTVRMADRIVVLDGGRVAEQGSHGELLKHGGLFAQLYAHQFGAPSQVSETNLEQRASGM